MGWYHEGYPGHEGYLVGIVQRGPGAWRELSYPADDFAIEGIKCIAIGCECGWRSSHVFAPTGTRWQPFTLELRSKRDEDLARVVWREHCESLRGVQLRDGITELRELVNVSRRIPRCTRGPHACQERCPDAFGVPCSPPADAPTWQP
jgi:hypothetical protein